MQITIPQPAKVINIPQNYGFMSQDNPMNKTVQIFINCGSGQPAYQFTLWSGDAYTNAGDYTQAQIISAVAAYLESVAS